MAEEERRELSGDELKAALKDPRRLLHALDACLLKAQTLETIAVLLTPETLTSVVAKLEDGRVVEDVSTYVVNTDDRDCQIVVTSRNSESGREFTMRFTSTNKSPSESA